MPPTPILTTVAKTPLATSSARPRCIDVVQMIDALAIDICTAGRTAALHLSTREGRVVVRIASDRLFPKIRAGRDANGKPFPVPVESALQVLERDAEATAPKADEATPVSRRRVSDQATALYQKIWAELDQGSLEPIASLAARYGTHTAGIYGWVMHHHPARWSLLLKRRRGKASQTELAELGFPLTKPSATSL